MGILTWLRACVLSKPFEVFFLVQSIKVFSEYRNLFKVPEIFLFFQVNGVRIERVLPPLNHCDLGRSHPSSLSLSFTICKDGIWGMGLWMMPLGEQSAS